MKKTHIDEVFGYWTVVNDGFRFVLARCICGNIKSVRFRNLENGKSKSCGCKKSELVGNSKITHGDSIGANRSRIYSIWACMLTRTRNKNIERANRYSERGIGVCKEWFKYESFKEWALKNGYSDGLSIDRIDNNFGYSPENCRWATTKTQANNKTTTKYVFYNGEKIPRAEFARIFKLNYYSVRRLQENSLTGEQIIEIIHEKNCKI